MKKVVLLICTIGFGFSALAQTDYSKILTDSISDPEKSKFSISLSSGIGLRTGSDVEFSNPGTKEFDKQLNTGLAIQLQPTYFITKKIGLGLLANVFFANAEGIVNITNEISGERITIDATQNDVMLFVGPAISGRYFYDKFYSGYSFAVGAQTYQSKLSTDFNNVTNDFKAFRWNWSLGTNLEMGYNINRDFSVFAKVNYFYSLINKIELTDPDGSVEKRTLKDEDREDTSRFGLGLGINYKF